MFHLQIVVPEENLPEQERNIVMQRLVDVYPATHTTMDVRTIEPGYRTRKSPEFQRYVAGKMAVFMLTVAITLTDAAQKYADAIHSSAIVVNSGIFIPSTLDSFQYRFTMEIAGERTEQVFIVAKLRWIEI